MIVALLRCNRFIMRFLSLLTVTLFFISNIHAQSNLAEGIKWREKGNYIEALKYFEKAKKTQPENLNVLKEYANAAFNAKKYGAALPVYENLLKSDQKNLMYLIRLAKIYSFSSKKQLSATYAEKALALNPTNPDDIFTLAEVFYFTKQYPKALVLYEKITNTNDKALSRAAKSYTKLNRHKEAISAYEKIILKKKTQVPLAPLTLN